MSYSFEAIRSIEEAEDTEDWEEQLSHLRGAVWSLTKWIKNIEAAIEESEDDNPTKPNLDKESQ